MGNGGIIPPRGGHALGSLVLGRSWQADSWDPAWAAEMATGCDHLIRELARVENANQYAGLCSHCGIAVRIDAEALDPTSIEPLAKRVRSMVERLMAISAVGPEDAPRLVRNGLLQDYVVVAERVKLRAAEMAKLVSLTDIARRKLLGYGSLEEEDD